MKDRVINGFYQMVSQLRSVGPVIAMVLLVPGGSLLALLLWLHQRRHGKA